MLDCVRKFRMINKLMQSILNIGFEVREIQVLLYMEVSSDCEN